MNKLYILILSFSILFGCDRTVKEDENLLESLMEEESKTFREYLDHRDDFEIQIIYTQIDRDENNRPSFRSFYFNVDSTRYFYPASTVKLPLVLLSLEKLKRLNIPGLTRDTPMLSDSVYAGQQSVFKDTTSATGLPSISHYAKKILVVSDNDAYNRLYEFVGQKEINSSLTQKGYDVRILHRLDRPLTPDQNRHTEAKRFVGSQGPLYQQSMLVNPDSIQAPKMMLKGTGHIKNDSLVQGPFDFTYKNFYPLTAQQRLLRALLFPQSVSPQSRFDITEEDRKFVMQYMSQLPRETEFPAYYQDTAYHDAYCKFLMFGNTSKAIPEGIRIFNKVGDAYGYLLDNAYVVDFENHVEFMLTAVILCNRDGVFNDGVYDYEKTGFPFMEELGRMIYNYERKRPRRHSPDLSSFVMKYDR